MAKRLKAMGSRNYVNGFRVTLHRDSLKLPLKWKKPQMIFVNSMGDLFHDRVPRAFIQDVFRVMAKASQHQFQVLTKRSARLCELHESLDWSDNVWMGVTVENEACRYRIDDLRGTGAKIKFLSLEPLLEPLPELNLRKIDWVIVGGESGPGARPMQLEWVFDIRDQCLRAGVPFFFKQWGGFNKKKNGRILDGRTWDELPVDLARVLK
jgi:protein gp37